MAEAAAGKPRGKRITTVEEPLGLPSEDDRLSDEQEQSVAEFMDEFGTNAETVKLYKYGDDGQPGYCGTYERKGMGDVEAFALRTYGGGKYQARLRDAGNHPLKSKVFRVYASMGAPVAAPASTAPDGVSVKLLEMHERRANDFQALLLAVLGKDRAPAPDPMEMLVSVMAVMDKVRPSQAATMDPVALLKELREAYRQGMEDQADREPSSHPYVDVLREVGAPLVGVLSALAARERGSAPVSAGTSEPKPGEIVQQPGQPALPAVAVPGWLAAVANDLPLVVGMAKRNMDAELVADMILSRVPDDVYGALVEEAAAPTWPEDTVAKLPTALSVTYREWALGVLRMVHATLLLPEPTDTDVGEPAGSGEA